MTNVLIHGRWGRLGTTRAAVFVWEGRMWLRLGRSQWSLGKGTSVELRRHLFTSQLRVSSGQVRASQRYPRPRVRRAWDDAVSDLFFDWPVDEADWDFGAFVEMVHGNLGSEGYEPWPYLREKVGRRYDC